MIFVMYISSYREFLLKLKWRKKTNTRKFFHQYNKLKLLYKRNGDIDLHCKKVTVFSFIKKENRMTMSLFLFDCSIKYARTRKLFFQMISQFSLHDTNLY
jgi:hypothetical protein